MATARIRAYLLPILAGFVLFVALFAFSGPAHAATRDELVGSYQSAIVNYEKAVGAKDSNAAEIVEIEGDIAKAEQNIELTQEELGETAATLYKSSRGNRVLVDMLLESNSFQDAVARYEKYEKIAEYYRDKADELAAKRERLSQYKQRLERKKAELEKEVEDAKRAADAAALALLDNTHTDGAQFQQVQGNGSNCGATAFIVGVNVLLHENRYPDNVGVWSSPSFSSDSTTAIAWKGSNWLIDNGLFDMISVETVPGDIHNTQDMRAWLEEGNVLVVSSGPGSVFVHADGGAAPLGSYPDGHFILVYSYDNGIFYANDSAVSAAQGAGCPYTEEQMQQWLSGRENHFAVALKKR